MAKFQWYVFNSEEPENVRGSNDVEEIEKYVDDPRYTVLSAQHGIYFNGDRDQKDVLALEETEEDVDEEEHDDEEDDNDFRD